MRSLIEEVTRYILPFIVTAGNYSVEIQKRIEHQKDKEQFTDPGSQALTDADLSVQNFIEVALLARYPNLKFYGEEYATSLNQKYFLGGDLEVWLDPIDGTLKYKNGNDQFSIIMTFLDKGVYQASIWYMPVQQEFMYGSFWGGVRQGNLENALKGEQGNEIILNKESKNIITYQLLGPLKAKLEDSGFRVIDLSNVDDEQVKNFCVTSFSKYSALVALSAGVIDLLVGGQFLAWGGGICTDIEGQDIDPIDVFKTSSYLKGVVAASSKELHAELLRIIA